MVNDALLSLLVCPLGKAPLRREGDVLICTRCGPRFSIEDDIPNMLIEEAELPTGLHARWPILRASRRGKQSSIDIESAGELNRRTTSMATMSPAAI